MLQFGYRELKLSRPQSLQKLMTMPCQASLFSGLVLVLLLGMTAPTAIAAELIPSGLNSKLEGGATVTESRGSSSTWHNPANLSTSRVRTWDADIALTKVKYTYQHTDRVKFKPTTVNVTAPPVGVGIVYPLSEDIVMGMAIVPTSAGTEQRVENVPLHFGRGLYENAHAVQKNKGAKLGLGLAYRLHSAVDMGIGLNLLWEDNKTSMFSPRRSLPFVVLEGQGIFAQGLLGFRLRPVDGLVLGLSYKSAVEKKYQGRYLLDLDALGEESYQSLKSRGYLPQSLGLGIAYTWEPVTGFFEVVREFWKQGRHSFSYGLPTAPRTLDLRDATHTVLGLRLRVSKWEELVLAWGRIQTNMGDGSSVFNRPPIGGMSFAYFDGLDRVVFSGGYTREWKLSFIGAGLAKIHGSRTVATDYTQEGDHQLSMMLLTFGGGRRF